MSANGNGPDAAASTAMQPGIFQFGSLRFTYTPAWSRQPITAQMDEPPAHSKTPFATEPKAIHTTPGLIRLNAALHSNPNSAPRFEGLNAGKRSRSTPPPSTTSRQAAQLNPYVDSFDMPSIAGLSLADQRVNAHQVIPPAIATSSPVAARTQSPDWPLDPMTTGRDAASARDETLVEHLRRRRAPPPQGVWQDPYYIFARFGKAGEVTPLVITENEHVRQSLISEKVAKRLREQRHGWKGRRQGHPDNRWIIANVSWPYNATHPDARPNGSLDYFFTKQIRFLVVPKIEMTNGIILARDELEGRNLKVTKGPFRPCLAVDGRRELGILLHSFPMDTLNATATDQPFRRLCHLAEFAATRKLQKKRRQSFHHLIAEESREYKLRDQAQRSRGKRQRNSVDTEQASLE
ncbi:hypothetical protein [Sporisorium scitamineum]|uniref:Uncharacterized protein n=1 Tax=Sporisorium scitamineum TaxID=49012 RepID=A0A0F7SBY5_9BASI|nr:hypothetical protein [Sporisorium scitamineum]